MRTLVIIPTYNERENLETVATAIMGLGVPDLAILVVDDRSPDGTGELADDLGRRYPERIFSLHRTGKLGLGSAYLAGFRFGVERGFEAMCEMDADGSHEPATLKALIAEVARGADVAVGSRHVAGGKIVGWGPHRHFMSNGAIALSRLALGLRTRDVTSGFRCYRRRVVEELLRRPIKSNGYAFQEETLFYCERLGFSVREVPIVFRDRIKGSSKLSWREIVQFFAIIGRLRRTKVKA
jgi:glycosyltransferase involved in cell wall biosynthesis